MIVRLIFFLFGGGEGFWLLRQKARHSTFALWRLFCKQLYYYCNWSMGSSIGLEAKIEQCPQFPHHIKGIFISHSAVIGKNCTIYQQVTIGSNALKTSKHFGAPIIGDNCIIGAGAKVIGNVRIGNNVCIGANAVVVEDVPDNTTVVCPQMRVIKHEGKTKGSEKQRGLHF